MAVKDDYLVETLADMGLVSEDDVTIARAEVESGEFEDKVSLIVCWPRR